MAIMFFKNRQNKINKTLKDERLNKKLNEHICFILENNGEIFINKETMTLSCKIKEKIYDLIVVINKNQIKYVYTEENLEERGIFSKINNRYKTEYVEIVNDENKKIITCITSEFDENNIEIVNETSKTTRTISINKGKLYVDENTIKDNYFRINSKVLLIKYENDFEPEYYIRRGKYNNDKYITKEKSYVDITKEEYIELKSSQKTLKLYGG